MKRAFVVVAALAVALVGFAPVASAANQPGQGERSTGRNVAGFGGEGFPHCHVLIVESAQEQFVIRVFPSHIGHASSGLQDGVFAADPNCDGAPG